MAPEVNTEPEGEKSEEELEEHNKKMRQKANGENPDADDNNNSDEDLLAGKYESEEDLQQGILEAVKGVTGAEDLEDAYKELETQFHSNSNSDDDAENNSLTIDDNENSEDEEGTDDDDDEDQNQIDLEKYEQEYAQTGQLSEESIEELEEAGYDRKFVNRYIRGVEAEVEEFRNEIFSVTGDEETYNQMLEWANDNLSNSEQEFFNEALLSGDTDRAKMAVESVYNRFQNADNSPDLVRGNKGGEVTGDRYESRQELMEDMGNPKYKEDPAFRRQVQEKLERSSIF